MKKYIVGAILALAIAIPAFSYAADNQPLLQAWKVVGSYIVPSNNSNGVKVPSLANKPCLGTDSSGVFGTGTCSGGSGSSTPSNGRIDQFLGNSSTNVPAWITATATSAIYIDGNSGVTNQNGSILFPFTTLTQAIASSTGVGPYGYNLDPGTYVDGPPDTFPNVPFYMNGNESTYVPASGVTYPGSFDIYDLTIAGNVTESDNSTSFIHQFNNGVITGNVTTAGLATFNGMALTGSTTVLTVQPGSLVNIVGGANYQHIIANGIQTNLNDDLLSVSTTSNNSLPFAVTSTSTGAQVAVNGLTLINTGTNGGGFYLQNGATSSPNIITNASIVVNSSTPGSTINCGTAACAIGDVVGLTNLSGTFIPPTGSNWQTLFDENRSVLNAFSVGTNTMSQATAFVQGINGVSPFAVASSTGTTMFKIDQGGGVIASTNQFVVSSSTGAISRIGNGAVNMTSSSLQMTSSGNDVLFENNVASANSGVRVEAGGTAAATSAIKLFVGFAEKARINGLGFFGIGTTSPTSMLFVQGTTSQASSPALTVASSTGTVMLQVAANASTSLSSLASAACDVMADTNGSLYCGTNGSGGGVTSVAGSGSINSSGGSTPTISINNLAANDVLFGQGSGTIGTSSNFTFDGQTLALTGTSTVSNRLGIGTTTPLQALVVQGNEINLSNASGTTEQIVLESNGAPRWSLRKNNTAESGGNAGSNFNLCRYDNTGSILDCPFGISRSSGNVAVGSTSPSGATFLVQGTSGSATNPFMVASSSGTSSLTVAANGSTTLSSLGTGPVYASNGSLYIGTAAAGGGNSAWTIGNGLIYNATSTDSVLVGTTTPTSAAFYLQGSGSKNPFTVASSTGTQLLTVLAGGNVGIGSSTPTAALTVQGAGTATLLFAVASSTGQQYLSVDGTAGNCVTTGLCLNIVNPAGQALLTVDGNGKVVASSTITGAAWLGGGTAPTVATSTGAGTGAGVTATLSNCSNSNCYITVNTGTAPVANQTILTLTFSTTYTNAPNCLVTMATNTAGSLLSVGATTTTSTLKILTSTALTASKQYGFYSWCPSN